MSTQAIEQFNASSIETITKEIASQIAAIADKHGINIQVNTGKYTENTFNVRVNGYCGDGVDVEARWKNNFIKHAKSAGLSTNDLGRTVQNLLLKHPEKTSYELVGMTAKSHDLVIKTKSGKFYRISANDIQFVDAEVEAPAAIDPALEPIVEQVAAGIIAEVKKQVSKEPLVDLDDDVDHYEEDLNGIVDFEE
jgi:hypothetical protein